jgi:hypothetical protein
MKVQQPTLPHTAVSSGQTERRSTRHSNLDFYSCRGDYERVVRGNRNRDLRFALIIRNSIGEVSPAKPRHGEPQTGSG